jgi:hypothetical protein
VVGELVEILFLFFQVRYGSKLSDGLLKKELEVCGSGGTKKEDWKAQASSPQRISPVFR